MKKSHLLRYVFSTAVFLIIICSHNYGQINVHHSDFNVSQGETFTTSGFIGGSPWQVNRSGADWGARIHNDILELTNTAGFDPNAIGWVYTHLETDDFYPPYNKVLVNNGGTLTWYFNMRQIRSNPAGFASNTYGVAFIIGCTSNDAANEGQGYAVVLGNTGTPDPVRFVKFDQGIQSIGTALEGLIIAGEPLDDPTNDHMSIKLTYDPASSEWQLFGRNDGNSFQDPLSGELIFLGNVIDHDYTETTLEYMGAYWQGHTAADQTAFFDNISVWIDDTGQMPPTISNVVQYPGSNITPETTVSVSADVTQGSAPIETVKLNWGVSEHNLENTILMIPSNNNTYTTQTDIPQQEDSTVVWYQVYAEDQAGESATSDLYSYQVIEPETALVIIDVINPQPIQAEPGTPFEDLPLPETIKVILCNEETLPLEVIWQKGDYDPYTPATYTLVGELVITEGIENPGNLKAEIEVTIIGPDLIAGWTFPEETQGADLGIPQNIGMIIAREPEFDGSYSFYQGVENLAISATRWHEGKNSKYWKIELSTLNYKDLTLSSAQRSSATGPRDFKVQYRAGTTESWNDLENSDIIAEPNFTAGVLDQLPLPDVCNNKSVIFLRWIMTSNTGAGGETVGSTGASRIDMIMIKGYYSENFTVILTGVENPDDITVVKGTIFEKLNLPDKVKVHYDNLISEYLPVLWNQENYKGDVPGVYTIEGEIELPQGIENPDNLKAYVTVEVITESHTVTFKLDMNNAHGFDPVNDNIYLTGTMFNNAPPGELHDEQIMIPAGNMIYKNTMKLAQGTYVYKYYINEGWNNPEGGENRNVEVKQDTTFSDKWMPTATYEWMITNVKIYPNPAKNKIYIESERKMKFVELINLKGQTVKRKNVENDFLILQLNDMVDGIYLLKITTDKTTQSKKIIIRKQE